MRVAAVIPHYPPGSRVGAWLSTHECLAHLVRSGHEVSVTSHLDPPSTYELDGVRVHCGLDRLPLEQRIQDADIVLMHLGDNLGADVVASLFHKPLVRMVHGHVDDAATRLDGCALAVFNSASLAAEIGWDGPQTVVHPITQPDRYRTTPGQAVTLVNLAESKGGDLLWRIARNMLHVDFIGVTGGYGTQILEPDHPNVTVLPTSDDMRAVYSQTRVLLMPSERETWGMVGVEAMTSGIPVIAHPTPGLRESLGEAGIFVDREDPNRWIDEINRLMHPDEWRRASSAATRRAGELGPRPQLERFTVALEHLHCTGAT